MSSDTAEKILDAADHLLADQGYAGTSVRAVAERAGVNKALVFYHYESKAKLIERVLERYYAAHLLALESAFAEPGAPRQRFHRVLDAYVDFIQDNQRFPRLVQQILSTEDERVTPLVQQGLAPMYVWVSEALADLVPKGRPDLSPRQFFVTFSNAVVGYFTQAPLLGKLWDKDPLSPAAIEERREHLHWFLDSMLDGLEKVHQ